jgi:hypothetical protein
MIEGDTTQPIQAAQMEAAALLAEAVEKATALGFTLCASGGTVDVYHWEGKPLVAERRADGLFEAHYLTNLIDWLDGVAFGRTNVQG